MKPSTHDPLIAAAADLLVEHPEISNPELLQRLVLILGTEVAWQIPVNRVQRHVREPAQSLLRQRVRDGGSTGSSLAGREGRPGKARRGASAPARRQSTPSRERVEAESVDRALLEAFELGVESNSRGEVVEAFRRLDKVRLKVGRILGSTG
ncbi:MAG: hypothetical protein WD960_03855 [Gemmatimonadota bacterium]